MKKHGGLKQRWFINTVSIILALGMVCVLAVTASFAAYYHSNMEADMKARAKSTTEFFAEYIDLNYNEFYQSCMVYAQTFADKDKIELQFINTHGTLVASSYGQWAGESPRTPEIADALTSRAPQTYAGRDSATGERIMAVSSPMIYSNGEIIGVLRFVTSTRLMDRQIVLVAVISLLGLCVILAIVLLSSNYFLHSIMVPVIQLTEKAKRISGGSYGVQIQTKYDDEIGELASAINEMSAKISQN